MTVRQASRTPVWIWLADLRRAKGPCGTAVTSLWCSETAFSLVMMQQIRQNSAYDAASVKPAPLLNPAQKSCQSHPHPGRNHWGACAPIQNGRYAKPQPAKHPASRIASRRPGNRAVQLVAAQPVGGGAGPSGSLPRLNPVVVLPTGHSGPLAVPLSRCQPRILLDIGQRQSRQTPLQGEPVSADRIKQRVHPDLARTAAHRQLRKAPDSLLQPVQLVGGTAGLLQHHHFAGIQDERLGDLSPKPLTRPPQTSRRNLSRHTDIISDLPAEPQKRGRASSRPTERSDAPGH